MNDKEKLSRNEFSARELWTRLKLDSGTKFTLNRLDDGTMVIRCELKTSDGLVQVREMNMPPVMCVHDHDAVLEVLKLELSLALLCFDELREKNK